jgi:hypothetical protein
MKTLTRINTGGGEIVTGDARIPARFELNHPDTLEADISIRDVQLASIWGQISAKPGTDISKLIGHKLLFEEVNRRFAFYFKFSSLSSEITFLDWAN